MGPNIVLIVVGPAFSGVADTMVACASFRVVRLSHERSGAACNCGAMESPEINIGARTKPRIRIYFLEKRGPKWMRVLLEEQADGRENIAIVRYSQFYADG
jgi:hypothetical protein